MNILKSIIAGASLTIAATSINAATIVSNAELGLQSLLDSTVAGGVIDVQNDQFENDAYWKLTNGGTSAATFMLEITGNSATQTFGIFDKQANGTINHFEIFVGSDTSSARKEITIYNDGSVYISTSDLTSTPTSGKTYAGSMNTHGIFGFYSSNGQGGYSYSDNALNGGTEKLITYQGRSGLTIDIANDNLAPLSFTNDDYILAFEDWTDNDFQDLVVNISSITAVPEPSSIVLMGLGVIGLGLTRRKIKSK